MEASSLDKYTSAQTHCWFASVDIAKHVFGCFAETQTLVLKVHAQRNRILWLNQEPKHVLPLPPQVLYITVPLHYSMFMHD